MENKQIKCVKGESCLHCGSNYCRFVDELEKLKQTITEIKEIAKNINEECFYDDFDCMNCDMQNGCTYLNKKQILQKISECEVLK